MGELDTTRRWIVLLNKAPKGPFSAEEIRELLTKGVIRRNDLASVVAEADGKKSEWKLIWQYIEFDRRAGLQPVNATNTKENSDRRKTLSAEEQRAAALKALPENWQDIAPEDLLPHSTSNQNQVDTTYQPDEFEKSTRQPSEFMPRMRAAFAGLVCVVGAYYFAFYKKSEPAPIALPKVVQQPAAVQVPARIPAQSRPVAPPLATQAAPAPMARPRPIDANLDDRRDADRGEIEEDEADVGGPKRTAIKRKRARPVEAEDEEAVAQDEEDEGDSGGGEEGGGEENPEDET
jgi:cell division septation protein DedD